jgi:hypothetical protein
MSDQPFRLSCLSVQEFFSRCNWQGCPPKLQTEKLFAPSLQPISATATPEMIPETSWQCLSVQEFLNLSNWQGHPLRLLMQPQAEQPSTLTAAVTPSELQHQSSWQCLSVQEFFSQSNWQGQPLTFQSHSQIRPSFSLILQVGEFFQCIDWEGKPEIGARPKLASDPELTPTSSGMTLTDLSELF